MVHRKTGERKTLSRKNAKRRAAHSGGLSWRMILLIFSTAALLTMLIILCLMNFRWAGSSDFDQETKQFCPTIKGELIQSNECLDTPNGIKIIDLQGVVDQWSNSVAGDKGIIIYDLVTEQVVGEYNADTKFETASLYKLFVVYEGYRRVQNGVWNGDNIVSGTSYTIMNCLDLAIRESSSVCAESMWQMIGREELNLIVQNEFDLDGVFVNQLTATPREIMKMMQLYHQHNDITDDHLIVAMQDSFLNQPITNYNWRQGLPSGFSNKVKVYNKVGWNYNGSRWTIYDDAAIIDFGDQGRSFIIVVMTSGIDFRQIAALGTKIEQEFYEIIDN